MRYYQCSKYPIEFVLSENIDKSFEPHNHVSHYIVSLVMRGKVAVKLENKEMTCRGGDVFIISPYTVHSVHQGRDSRLFSVCIGSSFIEETDCIVAEGAVREVLRDAIEQGILEESQKEKLLSSVPEIFRIRDNGVNEMDEEVKNLADKITSCPENELPIETLAADIFVSKYYLIKKFKSSMGMTPHQFRIQNRIRKSQRLLDKKKTIGRIATEMGFYDQSHFDKAFQKIVGISPSEYLHSKEQFMQDT